MAKAKWTIAFLKYRSWLTVMAVAIVAAFFLDAIPLQFILVLSVIAIGYILFRER